jgi:hypothetical protein
MIILTKEGEKQKFSFLLGRRRYIPPNRFLQNLPMINED